MEWVQTTGSTVEEAKDRALDELGVDEQDAEFEVLDEPKAGLFGRLRGEAKVKARVRPTQARAKNERRDRGRGKARSRGGRGKGSRNNRGEGGRSQAKTSDSDSSSAGEDDDNRRQHRDRNGGGRNQQRDGGGRQDRSSRSGNEERTSGAGKRRSGNAERSKDERSKDGRSNNGRSNGGDRQDSKSQTRKESTMTEDVAIEEQGEIVAGFLEGLLDAFGADGEVIQEQVDESTVELKVEGDDLGLLIGPRGATLTAVHEMCRTVLQREVAGGARARIRVDIGGYRERRRAALAEFARSQAEGVLEDQTQRALEPMGAADRKVIHDTVNDIDGVETISEGEDPKRRVVIVPENA